MNSIIGVEYAEVLPSHIPGLGHAYLSLGQHSDILKCTFLNFGTKVILCFKHNRMKEWNTGTSSKVDYIIECIIHIDFETLICMVNFHLEGWSRNAIAPSFM